MVFRHRSLHMFHPATQQDGCRKLSLFVSTPQIYNKRVYLFV